MKLARENMGRWEKDQICEEKKLVSSSSAVLHKIYIRNIVHFIYLFL